MIQSSVAHGHRRCPNGKPSNVELTTAAVSNLSSFIYELVESGIDVIRELDLGYGSVAHGSESNSETCNALLGERCVENTFTTCDIPSEGVQKSVRV